MSFLLAGPAILAALAFRWLHRRWSNPATIFLGILGVQLALYGALIGPEGYVEPSVRTLLAAGGGLLGFTMGYLVLLAFASPIVGRNVYARQRFPELPARQARPLFLLAIVCSLVALVWHTAAGLINLGEGGTGITAVDLRTGYLQNLDSFSIAPHIAIAAQFLLLYLYLRGFRPRMTLALFIVVSIGCAIWKMERSAVIMAGFSAIVAFEMRSGEALKGRYIAIAIATAASLFVVTALLRDPLESVGEVLPILADYFAKNLQNFDAYVIDQPLNGSVELVLGKYATVLGAARADLELGVDEYFNTYSYLRPVYLYGGIWFCLVFGGIVGALYGGLFLWSKRRPIVATFYCFAAFALFLSFFDYAFSWTNWGYYGAAAVALSVALKQRQGRGQAINLRRSEVVGSRRARLSTRSGAAP